MEERKNKVIWIEESDEEHNPKEDSKKSQDKHKDEIIFYKDNKYKNPPGEANSDSSHRPKVRNSSSLCVQDNTRPTKTQSWYKKSPGKNHNSSSPGIDVNINLGSAEDLLDSKLLQKITIVPKVNPRLRIIKEEEQKLAGSFAFTPKDDSIKKLDDEVISIPVKKFKSECPPSQEERRRSSQNEDIKSHELTEFYQYHIPRGKMVTYL